MRGFLLSLQSEFYKTRNTLAFWSAILLPLVLCIMVSAGFYSHADKLAGYTPLMQWLRISGAYLGVMGSLLLPILVIFQTYSINNIEHRGEMWKSLFSLPIPKWSIYTAKFTYALFLNALCLTLFAGFIIWSGYILNILVPELKLNQYDMSAMLFRFHLKLFLASAGILSIQFLPGLLWADFLKPMGIGFLLTLFGIITANLGWKYAFTIPYAQPMLALNSVIRQAMKDEKQLLAFDLMSKEVYASLAVAALFFVIGYFVVSRKSIK